MQEQGLYTPAQPATRPLPGGMLAPSTSALVEFRGPFVDGAETVFTPEALEFLLDLHRRFTPTLKGLLEERRERQAEYDSGILPDFDPLTAEIRAAEWGIAKIPAELMDRRVEITGPAERRMIVNALNSGAKVFMADLEDSLSPTFENIVNAQRDLRDAVHGTIDFVSPEGKAYAVGAQPAELMVRPRGLHLTEKHLCVDGEPLPAALVDFAMYAFHNFETRLSQGKGSIFISPSWSIRWRRNGGPRCFVTLKITSVPIAVRSKRLC
jgi:malate synthase